MGNVSVLEQSLLLGASLGLLLGVLFADFCGKKLTIVLSIVITLVGLILILVFDRTTIKCCGLVMWGAGS